MPAIRIAGPTNSQGRTASRRRRGRASTTPLPAANSPQTPPMPMIRAVTAISAFGAPLSRMNRNAARMIAATPANRPAARTIDRTETRSARARSAIGSLRK